MTGSEITPTKKAALSLRPKPSTLMATVRWYGRVYWHRLRAAARTPRWWVGNAIFLGLFAAVGWPVYTASITRGVLYTAMVLLTKVGLVRRLSGAQLMQLVPRDYLSRKALLVRLVLESRRGATATEHEVTRFQRETLALIENYVRSHREDAAGTEIFVNLLVLDGDDVLVIGRSRDHRQPGARYPAEKMLAARAISEGAVAYCGDVEEEWGTEGKPYRSILVLPIWNETGILGAVSIDSTRKNHFDIEHSFLERALNPYVALLVWTLERRNQKQLPQAAV